MLSPAAHHSHHRRRFGLTEVLLIAGILVFGALTLLSDNHQNFGGLLSGIEDVAG
jgi:hypothetical protein